MCHEQSRNIAPLNPGKYGIFPVLFLFSTRPSLKSGTSTPKKIVVLKLARQGYHVRKSLKLRLLQEFENGLFFWSNYAKRFAKHLNNKRLP